MIKNCTPKIPLDLTPKRLDIALITVGAVAGSGCLLSKQTYANKPYPCRLWRVYLNVSTIPENINSSPKISPNRFETIDKTY